MVASVRVAAVIVWSAHAPTSCSVFILLRFYFICHFQLEMQPHTQQTIYGLQIGREYEAHIRCRMQAFTKFGDFSDSIFIQVTEIPNKGKTVLRLGLSRKCPLGKMRWCAIGSLRMQILIKFWFWWCLMFCFFLGPTVPLTLVLIFGIVGIFVLIMLIVVSQQQR